MIQIKLYAVHVVLKFFLQDYFEGLREMLEEILELWTFDHHSAEFHFVFLHSLRQGIHSIINCVSDLLAEEIDHCSLYLLSVKPVVVG